MASDVSVCAPAPVGLKGQCHLKALSPPQLCARQLQLPGTHPMMQQMRMLPQAWLPLQTHMDRHTLLTVLHMQLAS